MRKIDFAAENADQTIARALSRLQFVLTHFTALHLVGANNMNDNDEAASTPSSDASISASGELNNADATVGLRKRLMAPLATCRTLAWNPLCRSS